MRKGGLLLGVVVAGATLALAMAAPVAFAQEMEASSSPALSVSAANSVADL